MCPGHNPERRRATCDTNRRRFREYNWVERMVAPINPAHTLVNTSRNQNMFIEPFSTTKTKNQKDCLETRAHSCVKCVCVCGDPRRWQPNQTQSIMKCKRYTHTYVVVCVCVCMLAN